MSRARDLADGTFSGSFSADSPTLVVDDANNRVGAGIASPSAPLHVAADSSTLSLRISGRSSDDRSDVEFYENDNTTKLTGFTNEPGYSLWSYGTRSIYTDSDAHIFRNGSATTLARLDSDGLKFNGDTAAANALDDYEEGTWTPAYSTTGVDFSSVTYNTTYTSGTYVKVGRNVTLRGYIRTEALTVGSATGGVIVTGIPFTSSNGINTITDTRCAGSVLSTNFSADGPSTLVINNNKTYFEAYSHNTIGSGTSAAIVNASDMRTTATSNIMTFTLNYYVD